MTDNMLTTIKEIYAYRNILKSMVFKELIGKYKYSVLGFGWHFVMPVMMLIVYYVVFSTLKDTPVDNYWIYLATGLFPFNFLLGNLTSGSGCIINNSNMVKKMYFPREIIALAQVISSFIIFLICYAIVLLVIIFDGFPIGFNIVLLPLALILVLIFTTGYVLAISAIVVYIRDIQYILNSISIAFFFLTPIYFIFDDSITGVFRLMIYLNPFTYFIELFHDIIYYGLIPNIFTMFVCVGLSTIALIIGVTVMNRLKKGFAERL